MVDVDSFDKLIQYLGLPGHGLCKGESVFESPFEIGAHKTAL